MGKQGHDGHGVVHAVFTRYLKQALYTVGLAVFLLVISGFDVRFLAVLVFVLGVAAVFASLRHVTREKRR